MVKAFFWSKKWILWSWGLLSILIMLLYFQVYTAILLNEWYQGFYNMLYKTREHTLNEFWYSLFFGIGISMTTLALVTATDYLARTHAFRWRKALTLDYLLKWQCNLAEGNVKCVSQRIHEDTFQFAKILDSLILQTARAIMTLIAFVPILWQLSGHAIISIGGWTIPMLGAAEGNLVWLAILATVIGMLISQCVSFKLPQLEYNNRNCEGSFRTGLETIEDKTKNRVTLENIFKLFAGVERNYRLLYLNYSFTDFWTGTYCKLMDLLPWLIFGPSLFVGTMLYGTLLQVLNAFQNVHGSLSMFNHNWRMLKELQGISRRLREFEKSLKMQEE